MGGKCGECEGSNEIHAKGFCYKCYKKQWQPKIIICKNCKKERKHHAFGLCSPCHMKLHHYDLIKSYNVRKYHNISLELYRKLATSCIVCGFDKIVELHHLDYNRQNNYENNLVALCPNHHKMLHKEEYSQEIKEVILKKKKEINKKN